MKMLTLAAWALLCSSLAAQTPAVTPAPFPPGATLEEKKAILRQRAEEARVAKAAAEAAAVAARANSGEPLGSVLDRATLQARNEKALRESEAKAEAEHLAKYMAVAPNAPAKPLREVETDQLTFVGKPVVFSGTLDVQKDFLGSYAKADLSHFAFALTDEKGNSVNLYVSRQRGAQIRERLIKEGPLPAECVVVMLPERFQKGTPFFNAELLSARLGQEISSSHK